MKKATKNINIRPLRKEDTAAYFRLIDSNRERLKKYFPQTMAAVRSEAACSKYIERKLKQVKEKELFIFIVLYGGKMAGVYIVKSIDWRVPKCELAYFIDRKYEGKGIMGKALGLLLTHCFGTFGMNKIFVRISPNNIASQRLVLGKGFKLEGVLRNEFRIGTGELEDILYYGILK